MAARRKRSRGRSSASSARDLRQRPEARHPPLLINSALPPDIRVLAVAEAPLGFSGRSGASTIFRPSAPPRGGRAHHLHAVLRAPPLSAGRGGRLPLGRQLPPSHGSTRGGEPREIGRGNRPPEWMAELLLGRDRTRAGPTAPAHALTLLRVSYPPERALIHSSTNKKALPETGGLCEWGFREI